MNRPSRLVVVVSLLMTLLSCSKSAYIGTPEGFARYDDADVSTAVSPEGVVIQARLEKNEPSQNLQFWAGALRRQLETSGYFLVEESDFASALGPGVLFEWAAPVNGEDWIYLTAIAATRREIAIVESAGSLEHYQRYRSAIRHSLTTLQVGGRARD